MYQFHPGWHLIYTRPCHEKKVKSLLTQKKIDSFLPTKKVLRIWHDRKKYIDEPLFPSYIFVYLNDLQNYYEGMDVAGALYYVRSGKEIARVHESVINNIKLVTDQANELEVSDTRFLPGRRLVINQGALTGLACEVVECNSKRKLLVRVDLLQRNILMTLPSEHLLAI